MTYGNQKAKSKNIKNNCKTEWEFTAKFIIQKESAEGIKISVFDEETKEDIALGKKTLNIAAMQEYKELNSQWIPLENCKSREVLLSAKFIPLTSIQKHENITKSVASKLIDQGVAWCSQSRAGRRKNNTEGTRRGLRGMLQGWRGRKGWTGAQSS